MPDLEHRNIKSINVDMVLYYQNHRIEFNRFNASFMLTIKDCNNTTLLIKIITDKIFNDCVLDLLNIALKPHIQLSIEEAEKNN